MTSAHMGAGYQPANVVWTFCMQPTGVSHAGFQVGSTGQATGQPNCRDVENGAILTTQGGVVIGPMMEPDTSLSAPQNLCLVATLRDVNGLQVLGGNDSGYGCVQPAANNSWCISGTCDFDNYVPNIPGLALGQSVTDLTVGNLNVTTCTGCSGLPNGPANEIVATPNGSSGVAGLRYAVPADIPSLPESQIANLTTDLAAKLATALNSADIFVGNGSNLATGVAMSGDCSLSNAGAINCTQTSGVAFGALATLAPGAFPSGYTIPWGQVTSQPTIPTSANWPNAGSCPSGQYEDASVNGSAPTCAQVQYSQIGSANDPDIGELAKCGDLPGW